MYLYDFFEFFEIKNKQCGKWTIEWECWVYDLETLQVKYGVCLLKHKNNKKMYDVFSLRCYDSDF